MLGIVLSLKPSLPVTEVPDQSDGCCRPALPVPHLTPTAALCRTSLSPWRMPQRGRRSHLEPPVPTAVSCGAAAGCAAAGEAAGWLRGERGRGHSPVASRGSASLSSALACARALLRAKAAISQSSCSSGLVLAAASSAAGSWLAGLGEMPTVLLVFTGDGSSESKKTSSFKPSQSAPDPLRCTGLWLAGGDGLEWGSAFGSPMFSAVNLLKEKQLHPLPARGHRDLPTPPQGQRGGDWSYRHTRSTVPHRLPS